jgi:7-keto-8-aminopelargonate synthetase-like enzyme
MRSLPRRNASPAFTTEVMAKIGQGRPAAPFVWRLAAAVAMAACLVAVLHLAAVHQLERTRTAELRAETRQLGADLEAVKRIASEIEPVVVLEDDRGTRVIMDLASASQPISYRTYD